LPAPPITQTNVKRSKVQRLESLRAGKRKVAEPAKEKGKKQETIPNNHNPPKVDGKL